MDEDHDDGNGVAKITVVKEHVTWMKIMTTAMELPR